MRSLYMTDAIFDLEVIIRLLYAHDVGNGNLPVRLNCSGFLFVNFNTCRHFDCRELRK